MSTKKPFQHLDCIKRGGKFWFSPDYAGHLLKTSARKIEMAIIRRLLPYRTIEGRKYLPESTITALRRDPEAVKAIKKKMIEKSAPQRPEIGGRHQRGPDQEVLPIADYRLPLNRTPRYK